MCGTRTHDTQHGFICVTCAVHITHAYERAVHCHFVYLCNNAILDMRKTDVFLRAFVIVGSVHANGQRLDASERFVYFCVFFRRKNV